MSKLRRISRVLKERFPNLTADETIELAERVLAAVNVESGSLLDIQDDIEAGIRG